MRSRLVAGAGVLALVLVAFVAGTLVAPGPAPVATNTGMPSAPTGVEWVVPPEEIGTVADPSLAASAFVEKAIRQAVPAALKAQSNQVGELRRRLDTLTFGDGRFGVSENLFRTAELTDFLPTAQMDDIRAAGGHSLQFKPGESHSREMTALHATVEVWGQVTLQFTMLEPDKSFTQDAAVVVWLVRESTDDRWTADAVQVLER